MLFKAVGLRWPVRAEGIDGLGWVRTLGRSNDLSPASPKRLIEVSDWRDVSFVFSLWVILDDSQEDDARPWRWQSSRWR